MYGRLLPNNVSELKPWGLLNVDLVGTYSKSIRQQQLGGAIINNNFSLACMTVINPTTGWFEIFKVPSFDLDEVTDGNKKKD